MARAFTKKQNLPQFEPRWFIWTITFLIAIGVSLSGYIMVSAEQDSTQAYDAPFSTHLPAKK